MQKNRIALPACTYCFDHAQDHIPDDGYMTEYDGTATCQHRGCTAKVTQQIVGDDGNTTSADTEAHRYFYFPARGYNR